MNLLQTLLNTYDAAAEEGIVDQFTGVETPSLLPLYHSNRRSVTGDDIIELTIDENGFFLHGRLLNKNEYIVFPVSEESLIRTSKPSPHPICDEFSYVIPPDVTEDSKEELAKQEERHNAYRQAMDRLFEFVKKYPNPDFTAIYRYVTTGEDLRSHIVQTIKNEKNGTDYILVHNELCWKETNNGKIKNERISLSKLFVTFAVAHSGKTMSVTENKELHQFYAAYMQQQNEKKPKEYCDITGSTMYCVSVHRGVIGTAKLIGISNHRENYIGRFTDGEQIVHVGYETSQKIHNMLKYLIDSSTYKSYLGGNAYVISWMSQELDCGGAPLMAEIARPIDEKEKNTDFDPFKGENWEDNEEEPSGSEEAALGMSRSRDIVQYFSGTHHIEQSRQDSYFCVLVLEKVNNGRMAVKYFRSVSCSDMQRRIESWYKSMSWPVWSPTEKKIILKTPSIPTIVNFLYGAESNGMLTCRDDKVRRAALERLIPCVMEGRRLPRDMMQLAFYRLINRQAYPKQWNHVFFLGCTIIKKYAWDHDMWNHDELILKDKGVMLGMDERSFTYGRLLAVYHKMEVDALGVKRNPQGEDSPKIGEKKKEGIRMTNAERFWSAMIHQPLKTAAILETRTKYYKNVLGKNDIGAKIYYEKILGKLYIAIKTYEENSAVRSQPANEDFILGYYYQQQELYKKKDKISSDDTSEYTNDTAEA